MEKIDKKLVEKRFSRGLPTYTQSASIQPPMAQNLLSTLIRVAGNTRYPRILEIGAGSGILTDLIDARLVREELVLLDIVPECGRYHRHRPHATFLAGDAETTDPGGPFDLIISNAAFQWLHDLTSFLPKLRKNLCNGGILAFTTFGPENLRELKEITGSALPYRKLDDLTALLCKEGNFEVLEASEKIEVVPFGDPLSILKHLKQTGVSAPARKQPVWTRGRLARFSQDYRSRFSTEDGHVNLTYHPITLIAKGR